MKKINLTILFLITALISIGQINFGNDTSIEIDWDDSYRVYMKFDNPEVMKVVNSKLQKALVTQGIIQSVDNSDSFQIKQKIDGLKAYEFEVDEYSVDLYINKEGMDSSSYNELKKVCKEIHDYIKSNHNEDQKSSSYENPKPPKTPQLNESRSQSFHININVENTDQLYDITAKYDEKGQFDKLIDYFVDELGSTKLAAKNGSYTWEKEMDDQLIYKIQVSKGKFKAIVYKENIDGDYFDQLITILEVGKKIVKD